MNNTKVTTGKKDILGQPIIGGFEGTREIETGSLIKIFKRSSGFISEFQHHGLFSANIKIDHFKEDKHLRAFKVISVEGTDEKGNIVEVKLFLEKDAPINLI